MLRSSSNGGPHGRATHHNLCPPLGRLQVRRGRVFQAVQCRKHFRWTQNGKQHRTKTGTRSWAEAEEKKRHLEDQLAGRARSSKKPSRGHSRMPLRYSRRTRRIRASRRTCSNKYARELDRLRAFAEARKASSPWPGSHVNCSLSTKPIGKTCTRHPTPAMVQARLKNFLRFCYDHNGWTAFPGCPPSRRMKFPRCRSPRRNTAAAKDRAGQLSRIAQEGRPGPRASSTHAGSGLAIRDAVTLRRDEIIHDKAKKLYRIVTARQKTGTHVSVPNPARRGKRGVSRAQWQSGLCLLEPASERADAVTNWQQTSGTLQGRRDQIGRATC